MRCSLLARTLSPSLFDQPCYLTNTATAAEYGGLWQAMWIAGGCRETDGTAATSLQSSVNLGAPAIAKAHRNVISGESSWVVYTLGANNELKVEEESSFGTLDELQEEFSDGK
jgi:hypothetical protein